MNVAGITAGILVPVFVIALAIGGYFGYKKWKERRDEQQIKEDREKKQ